MKTLIITNIVLAIAVLFQIHAGNKPTYDTAIANFQRQQQDINDLEYRLNILAERINVHRIEH